MGLPVEHTPVGMPPEKMRHSFLFARRPQDTAFYEDMLQRWQSFQEKPMTRRTFLRRLGLSTFAASLVAGGMYNEQVELGINWLVTEMTGPDAPLTIPENAESKVKKAMLLYNNMITRFGTHNELMLEKSREFNPGYAQVWSYSRAIDATYAMQLIPGIGSEPAGRYKKMFDGLETYWSEKPQGHRPGYDPGVAALNSYNVPGFKLIDNSSKPDRYVDDNLWIGHLLMREYWQSGDRRSLYRAKQVFELAVSQWDNAQGGIYWKQQFDQEKAHGRGMVSNATAIMLGVELYKALYAANGDDSCMKFCDKTYQWIQQNLKDSKDGLYFDNKDYTGKVDEEKYTYCQGVMIGAMVKLSEIDPEKYKLKDALQLANNSLTYFDNFNRTQQALKKRQDPEAVFSEGYEDLAYTAIYFANLLYLSHKVKDDAFTKRVQTTLGRIANKLHSTHDTLLDQAGAVHLAALNCLDEGDYRRLYKSPLFIGT